LRFVRDRAGCASARLRYSAEADRREVTGNRSRHRVGERFANVGEQHGRAVDGNQRLQPVRRDPADREDAGLGCFDEEERLVADLRREGHREDALVDVRLDLFAARAQPDLDLRLLLREERLGGSRAFEREVLDVDLVDGERDALRASPGTCGSTMMWCPSEVKQAILPSRRSERRRVAPNFRQDRQKLRHQTAGVIRRAGSS
jgi:hypothetical protein